MARTLVIILCLVSTVTYSQSNIEVDSLYANLEQHAKSWDPSAEPWTFITFKIKEPKVKITYGQQSIHPFLAEYSRRIHFSTPYFDTDTLSMIVNTGGRTLIDVYTNKSDSLILRDNFGKYIFDYTTKDYSEIEDEPLDLTDFEHIGVIDGQTYPLRFERN